MTDLTNLAPIWTPAQGPLGQTVSFPESSGSQLKKGAKSRVSARRSWSQALWLPCPDSWAARCADLVGTETLQGVVGKLVSHVHQAVVGVDVVQAVGLGLAGGLADVLAVPKETVEVELVGVLAVRREARVAARKPQPRRSLVSRALPAGVLTVLCWGSLHCHQWYSQEEHPRLPSCSARQFDQRLQIPACIPASF